MPRPTAPPLLLCAGKDCRGEKGYEALREAAESVPGAASVPCQGICHGPLVGIVVDGEVRWISKVREPKLRRQVIDAVTDGELTKALREREERKHRGEIEHPKKAVLLRSGKTTKR